MSLVKLLWSWIPQWIRHTARAIGFVAVMLVGFPIIFAISDESTFASLATTAVFLLVALGSLVLLKRTLDRKLGGPGQIRLLRQAVRTGVVPDSASKSAWLDAAAGRKARRDRTRGYGLASIVVITLFLGTQFVIAFVRQPENRLAIASTGTALIVLVDAPLLWIHLFFAPRRRRRVDALFAKLEDSDHN